MGSLGRQNSLTSYLSSSITPQDKIKRNMLEKEMPWPIKGWKNIKIAKEHGCTAHGHRQWCGDGQGGRGCRSGWVWAKVGVMDICKSIHLKKILIKKG